MTDVDFLPFNTFRLCEALQVSTHSQEVQSAFWDLDKLTAQYVGVLFTHPLNLKFKINT